MPKDPQRQPDGLIGQTTPRGAGAPATPEVGDTCNVFGAQSACHNLLNNLPVGVFHATLDGMGQYMNPAVESITGLPNAQTMGSGWSTALHPEDRERVVRLWTEALAKQSDYASEHRYVHADGKVVMVSVRATPLRENGVVTGYVGIIQDMTKRMEAEGAARLQADRLRLILASTDAGTWDWDIASGSVRFNARWAGMLGYAPHELQPHISTWENLVHPDDLPKANALMDAHFSGANAHFEAEVRMLAKDGSWRWVLNYGRVVERDSQGRPTRMVGTHTDIDQRRRVQGELEMARERFELAVRGSNDGIWDWNVTGGTVYFSPRFYYLLGYLENELPGTYESLQSRVHPDDLRSFKNAIHRLTASRVAVDVELRMQTKDGRWLWFRLRGHGLWDDSGAATRITGSLTDITQTKEAEAHLLRFMDDLVEAKNTLEQQVVELASKTQELERARQAAETANRAKSEFLANMSHEIRTPMTAILGYADLMLDPNQNPTDRIDCIQTIRRSGSHLLALINDILDLSKIEAGKFTLENIECSPGQLIQEVAALLEQRAADKGIAFGVEYAGGIPETIRTDPTRFKQVLTNLAGNAVKFTESGGVRICARMSREGGHDMLVIEVVDTGIGLGEDQLARLFQPFQQADNSMTRRFGGTGLGLVICKNLTEMLGGGIHVSSTPGEGSTFTFSVATGSLVGVAMLDNPGQMQSRPRRVMDGAATQNSTVLKGRILLAEDGVDNQRLISLLLRKAGAEVTLVDNGKAAAEAALLAWRNSKPFDVILLDMQMPVMDGYSAAATLRTADYPGPIIALTAHAMSSDREKCLRAGCDDYLTKPIDRAAVIAACSDWVTGAKRRQSQPQSLSRAG